MEALCAAAWDEIEPVRFEAFAVRAKRSDKTFPHSTMEIESIVGRSLLDKLRERGRDVRVRLKDPDVTCHIEAHAGAAAGLRAKNSGHGRPAGKYRGANDVPAFGWI